MKYLLDTHTAIWAFANDAKLSYTAKSIIADTSNSLCISIVSAWELAIKISLGKLDLLAAFIPF
jgi:PIN domain nuclease of toxin-antitoxin system